MELSSEKSVVAVTAAAIVSVLVLFKCLTHVLHELIEYCVENLLVIGALEFQRVVVVVYYFKNDNLGVLAVVLFGFVCREEYGVFLIVIGDNVQQVKRIFIAFLVGQIDVGVLFFGFG